MSMRSYGLEESGAFVDTFSLHPYRSGPLEGLHFAVKDNIDIANKKTSYGSKAWRDHHPLAVHNALCVEQLLSAGATCDGKTVSDEYTYSLDGESYFYGTPLNPRAPERIPGGSSSGSASAVACRLVDFSLGTDAGGSIRVPASLCGVWGMRPSLHRVSEAGVIPFMPSVSTVGAFSNDISVLEKSMRVLLRSGEKELPEAKNIYLFEDAFSIADTAVSDAVRASISHLGDLGGVSVSSIRLSDIVGEDLNLVDCNERALRILQSAEFANTVGGWLETFDPQLGPAFQAAYQNVKELDRTNLNEALSLCESLFDRIQAFTKPGDLFCFPTTPTIAPLKGSLNDLSDVLDFYDRTGAIASFAGVSRMPEISVPLATVGGIPVGTSIAAGYYQDEFLLSATKRLFSSADSKSEL